MLATLSNLFLYLNIKYVGAFVFTVFENHIQYATRPSSGGA